VEEMLPTMVTKCIEMHVLPKLANVTTIFASFDLWMFKGGIETFPLLSIISLKLGCLCMILLGYLR
jgi:hypothetical protein